MVWDLMVRTERSGAVTQGRAAPAGLEFGYPRETLSSLVHAASVRPVTTQWCVRPISAVIGWASFK